MSAQLAKPIPPDLKSIVAELQDLEQRKRLLLQAYNILARTEYLADHKIEKVAKQSEPRAHRNAQIEALLKGWKD